MDIAKICICTYWKSVFAKRKQRAWKEKLERIEDGTLVKKVYTEEIAGSRPRGRSRKKWIDSFQLHINLGHMYRCYS